jgi:hypothetical protein
MDVTIIPLPKLEENIWKKVFAPLKIALSVTAVVIKTRQRAGKVKSEINDQYFYEFY